MRPIEYSNQNKMCPLQYIRKYNCRLIYCTKLETIDHLYLTLLHKVQTCTAMLTFHCLHIYSVQFPSNKNTNNHRIMWSSSNLIKNISRVGLERSALKIAASLFCVLPAAGKLLVLFKISIICYIKICYIPPIEASHKRATEFQDVGFPFEMKSALHSGFLRTPGQL